MARDRTHDLRNGREVLKDEKRVDCHREVTVYFYKNNDNVMKNIDLLIALSYTIQKRKEY